MAGLHLTLTNTTDKKNAVNALKFLSRKIKNTLKKVTVTICAHLIKFTRIFDNDCNENHHYLALI